MVAMNVERINETLPESHYVLVEGSDAANVIAVSLMTESEQAIAVTLHRAKKIRMDSRGGSSKKAPTESGRGRRTRKGFNFLA
jgi:hypothetical protein